MATAHIVPVGMVDIELLRALLNLLPSILPNWIFELNNPVPPPIKAYSAERKQYKASVIALYLPKFSGYTLGITPYDIYEEGFNFLFGLAMPKVGKAIVSYHRLRPEFYGFTPNFKLLLERLGKEAVHELLHLHGLHHCPNSKCVMSFSNSLLDTDLKEIMPCEQCRRKITSS